MAPPDPATLEHDRAALASMATATAEAWHGRKVSPVYSLLPHLREPDWKEPAAERAQRIQRRLRRVGEPHGGGAAEAVPRQHPGARRRDPTLALRIEARRTAGESLLKLKHYDFALEQFEAVLVLDPEHKVAAEKKAVCLGRLGRFEEARVWVRQLTDRYPTDPEVGALGPRREGQLDQPLAARGRQPGRAARGGELRGRGAGGGHRALLQGLRRRPSHHYSGINALTLHLLRRHLGGETSQAVIDNLLGGVLWAGLTAQERDRRDYWARATYAELCLLVNPIETVRKECSATVAAANRDWFALDSTCQTLCLLRDLQFRPAETAAAVEILERGSPAAPAIPAAQGVSLQRPHDRRPGREPPRFPAGKEGAAAQKIGEALDALGAGPGDLALTQGASGGDILFLEACQARGVRACLMLPLEEPEFIDRSILPATDGAAWCERYYAVKESLQDPPG